MAERKESRIHCYLLDLELWLLRHHTLGILNTQCSNIVQ